MNVGQLKELIENIPDSYTVQVNVDVEQEDLPAVLTQILYANNLRKNDARKSITISSDLLRNVVIDL